MKGLDYYSLAKEQFREALYEIASVTGPVIDPFALIQDTESLKRAVLLFKSLEPNLEEIDDPESLWMLAEMYSHGLGGLEQDGKKAIRFFEMGICLGSTKAALLYGIRLLYGVRGAIDIDEQEAFKYLKMAADDGDDSAQNIVGSMMCFGHRQNHYHDPTVGVQYLKKSDMQNNILAADNLGKVYEKGIGVDAHLPTSFKYYMKAAQMGHPNSQYKVGEMFIHGTVNSHVKERHQEGIKWLLASSQAHYPEAMRLLGTVFRDGVGGVRKDIETAKKFLLMALDSGLMEAASDLIQLEHSEQKQRELAERHVREEMKRSSHMIPDRQLPEAQRTAATKRDHSQKVHSQMAQETTAEPVINFKDYVYKKNQ